MNQRFGAPNPWKVFFGLFNNHGGQFLIQVLVAGAVGLVIALAMISLQMNQFRENRALKETLASLEFHRVITGTLARSES